MRALVFCCAWLEVLVMCDILLEFLSLFTYMIISFSFFPSNSIIFIWLLTMFCFRYRCCVNPKDKWELPSPLWHQRPLPAPLTQRWWGQGLWYFWLRGFVYFFLWFFSVVFLDHPLIWYIWIAFFYFMS